VKEPQKEKTRLDVLLARRGLFATREQARRAVLAGEIFVDGLLESKAGTAVSDTAAVEWRQQSPRYVSRGGFKLEKALKFFALTVEGRDALDVGASTGGFTDCLLQHGARHVWAVDVGYGQLDWQLRNDSRVTVLERTNIRKLEPDRVPAVDVVTIDVAFISLAKVFPAVIRLLKPDADIVALIKPQFEAGREAVGKRGVIRDPDVHVRVLRGVMANAQALGLSICAATHSPIKGPRGNIEFLLHASWRSCSTTGGGFDFAGDPESIVEQAHLELGGN
jgi:23S rRNA (cytidine1920-2'-O)/16S rRNA (cytidine1409-2'-O)-methyltransferase